MPENFSFTAPSFESWDSSSGPENLPPFPPIIGKKRRLYPAMLTVAENCRFSQKGGVSIRGGSKNIASLGTGLKVDAVQGFETDNFKVLFAKSGTKVFQSNNPDAQTPVFYDIGLTRTASQVDFMFPKRKDLFVTNQIDGETRIFVTLLSANADVANSAITVPAGDTDDFAASGTFYIRGIAITYTKAVTFTSDDPTDTFTAAGHLLQNGVIVTVSNSGGALPSGLTAGTTYYVVNKTANTFQLSTTLGGSALAIASAGSGTNTFVAEDGIIRACTGLTSAMVTGDIVTQTTAYANNPKASTIAELLGAQLAAGVLSDPTALDYSVQSTKANPEKFYDFSGSGSGSKPMPRDITALLTGTSNVLIGLLKGLNYASDFDSTGALVTAPLSTVHGIPNAKCMSQGDENFHILTDAGRILPVGQTNAGFKVIEDPKNPHNDFDYPVQRFVQENIDKTTLQNNFQHYDPSSRTLQNCIQLTTGITTEIVNSTDTGGWSRDTGKTFSCKTVFKGRTYCGSDNTDIIYIDNEGLDDDGVDIAFRIVTGLMNYAGARITLDNEKITIGGLLSAVGQFIVNVYTDGEFAFTQTVTAAQMIAKRLMSTSAGIPIGDGNVGYNRIGNGADGTVAFPFICPIDVMFTNFRTIQLEIISYDAIEIRNFDVEIEHEGEELIDTF